MSPTWSARRWSRPSLVPRPLRTDRRSPPPDRLPPGSPAPALGLHPPPRRTDATRDVWGGCDVTAWNRLSREATLASLGKLAAATVAVVVMARVARGPGHDHRTALLLWLAVGAVAVAMQAAVPWLRRHTPGVEIPYLLTMGGLDLAAVVAVVALSGGVSGPFWMLLVVNTAGAAVIAPTRTIAVVQSLGMAAGLVLATALAHRLDSRAAGPLVVVSLGFPLVAVLGSSVSTMLERQRLAGDTERERLQAEVGELSAALTRAARGDLSTGTAGDLAGASVLGELAGLFDETLGNLRNLVGQIRAGGEQI